jgi:hypothetical protein
VPTAGVAGDHVTRCDTAACELTVTQGTACDTTTIRCPGDGYDAIRTPEAVRGDDVNFLRANTRLDEEAVFVVWWVRVR